MSTDKERRLRKESKARMLTTNETFIETADTETEIDLTELIYRLLEKVKYIILFSLLFALVAGVYAFFIQTPMYKATAKLYVMSPSDSAINLSDLQIGTYLTNDYQEVFKTWEVHEMVVKDLGLSYTYEQMQDMLTVTNPTDTRILYITVTSADPGEATNIANEYASVAQKYISSTMATEEPNVLSVALRPTLPTSPNKTKSVLIGLILGFFLSVAVITVQFVMDDKIKTAEDISKYAGLATLAIVPILNESVAGKGKTHKVQSSVKLSKPNGKEKR
jgi:capsular polysaccharide biosynthesis protein